MSYHYFLRILSRYLPALQAIKGILPFLRHNASVIIRSIEACSQICTSLSTLRWIPTAIVKTNPFGNWANEKQMSRDDYTGFR